MAVAPSSSYSLNLFIVGLVFLLVVPQLLLHVSCKAGFSHRDSPKLHPASTPLSPLNSSIRRSASYADYLRTANPDDANSLLVRINNEGGTANPGTANSPQASIKKKGASAKITSYYSHYVVSFQIGLQQNEGHDVSAVLEVADDFTWLFCDPCPTCTAGRIFDPCPTCTAGRIFDPSMSDTYDKLDCNLEYCDLFEKHDCDDQHMCRFSHKYYPGTANGTLSEDTVTMRSAEHKHKVVLKKVIFGCINAIQGNHFKHSMGVLGLGSGELSLVSQIGAPDFDKRFSYCLPSNYGFKSHLKIGSVAKVEGDMRSTILHSSDHPFHKITLTNIYIGTSLHKPRPVGKIVISTSIFNTHIDNDSLKFISEEVKKRVNLVPIPLEGYDLCYDTTKFPANFKMPEITLIFRKNGKLVLEEDNAFVRFDTTTLCLAILSNDLTRGTSVLGSRAQKGYLMLFDVANGELLFSYYNKHC